MPRIEHKTMDFDAHAALVADVGYAVLEVNDMQPTLTRDEAFAEARQLAASHPGRRFIIVEPFGEVTAG